MAKKESTSAKYIILPGAKGQVWAAKPLYERKDGGKFDFDKPETLTQEDLEYLFKNGLTNQVIESK